MAGVSKRRLRLSRLSARGLSMPVPVGAVFIGTLVVITSGRAAYGFASTPNTGCSSVTLFGYKQVGDYLSFDNEPDADGEGEEGERNESGGLFDVNTYFASFRSPIENSEENVASSACDEAASFMNFEIGMPPTETPEILVSSSPEEIIAYNNARLCPKNLLTQRAIQSFMFLCDECRDPHSGEVVWRQRSYG